MRGGGIKHQFLLGHSIPFFLEQIGKDIDFLILDTTHSLPGELLDFVVCLPYLKNGCIVVLHDAIENLLTCRDAEVATKLLFDTVTATDKYLMWEEGANVGGFPNIVAFKVEEETRTQIRDTFSALTITWGCFPESSEKQKYRASILQNYGERYLEFVDKIEILQTHTCLQKRITEHYGKDIGCLKMKWQNHKKVFLYGAGDYGNVYYQWGRMNELNISGFVISDDQEKVSDGYAELPIYYLSELPYKPEECAIIVAVDRRHQGIILQNLIRKGYYNIL